MDHVLPNVVMATPVMLTSTATTFATLRDSWPRSTPNISEKSPADDDRIVVLATLVSANAAFDKYCKSNQVEKRLSVAVPNRFIFYKPYTTT